MTSAPPCGISRASMLPMKLMSLHSFKSGNVSFAQRIALLFLRTDVDDRHTRILDSNHVFHVDGSHLCKLYQMGRSCIDIGAAVDQQGHALFCRNQWSQWRTFNAL